jgi:hypothetical protein
MAAFQSWGGRQLDLALDEADEAVEDVVLVGTCL